MGDTNRNLFEGVVMEKAVCLRGRFTDQRGVARRGTVLGHNGYGVPCRVRTWVRPELPCPKGKNFEVFDDQIETVSV